MNKYHFNYMVEDAMLGIKRNAGSVVASITLTFIAIFLIGQVLLVRAFVDDAISYVESQLSMKVYVEEDFAEEVAKVLKGNSFATNVEIESGEQMLDNLSFFFTGKEHLLEAFKNVQGLDAVKFQVEDKSLMSSIAENLETINGIRKVVYPQQMAETLANWITKINYFGILTILIFIILSFVMVYITFHLAIYQRKKELKVKMFLGIKPNLLRAQFLLEGSIIGFLGALFAIMTTILIYFRLLVKVNNNMPYLGQFTTMDLIIVVLIQLVVAIWLSIAASYIATRKIINYV